MQTSIFQVSAILIERRHPCGAALWSEAKHCYSAPRNLSRPGFLAALVEKSTGDHVLVHLLTSLQTDSLKNTGILGIYKLLPCQHLLMSRLNFRPLHFTRVLNHLHQDVQAA